MLAAKHGTREVSVLGVTPHTQPLKGSLMKMGLQAHTKPWLLGEAVHRTMQVTMSL